MRDIRKKNWFWIENALVDREDIGAMEKLIYMLLARFADQEGKCFPSQERLCKISGIKDYRTIVRYMESLEEKGLISIEKEKGKKNTYYLKNVEKIEEVPTKNVGAINAGTKNVGANFVEEVPTKNVGAINAGTKNVGANFVEEVPTKNVGQTIHNEQNIKKEKNKKENFDHTKKLLNYIETLEIDSEKKKIFKEWVEYKKSKGQYKDTKSLDILIKRFIKYSVQELRDIVEKSIMNNYSGIFEPKEINKTVQGNNNEISKMTPEERERMIKAKYFGGA